MKFLYAFSILFIIFSKGFSQNMRFELHGNYNRSVTLDKLISAQSLADFSQGFPSSWIADSAYISSEIEVLRNGISKKVYGKNEKLNSNQKMALALAEIGSEIVVNVQYQDYNPEARKKFINKIHYIITVIPDVEAEFNGGKAALTQFFEDAALEPLKAFQNSDFSRATVGFTINEMGETTEAKVINGCGNPAADQILLLAIQKMPKWKPAKNAKGNRIKQDFRFTVYGPKEGC